MKTRLIAVFMVAVLAAARAESQSPAQRAVLAVADSALAAISRGDNVALADLMLPEGTTTSIRGGDTTRYRVRTRDQVRAQASQGKIVERGFNGEARVSGPLASVWLPYDLYIDGKWSHCGVDLFTLILTDGKWRISNISWTIEQPPACQKHPSGPPA